MLTKKYPGLSMSVTALSRTMRDIFPNVFIKRLGKKRVSCIIGIELRPPHSLDLAPIAISCPAPTVTTSVPSSESQVATVMLELQIERDRRAALEIEVEKLKRFRPLQTTSTYQQRLCEEVDSTVCSRQMLVHGPDTVERFEAFSMSGLMGELESHCPELYQLLKELGSTQRNSKENTELANEELKVVVSICTLLNARSARVKGLQLLMSLMLVCRGVGRQV